MVSHLKIDIISNNLGADPTCYTIFHQVTKVDDCVVLFSATYAFRYPSEYVRGGTFRVMSAINGGTIGAVG